MDTKGEREKEDSTHGNGIVYKDLSYRIVGLAMRVHTVLGNGFLEKVYENSLMVLLRKEGIAAQQQSAIPVYFEGERVGEYFADIVVEDKIILELKVATELVDEHRGQMWHYLKATEKRLGLLLNFGKSRLEYERIVN